MSIIALTRDCDLNEAICSEKVFLRSRNNSVMLISLEAAKEKNLSTSTYHTDLLLSPKEPLHTNSQSI